MSCTLVLDILFLGDLRGMFEISCCGRETLLLICDCLKRCGIGVQTAGSGRCRFKLG